MYISPNRIKKEVEKLRDEQVVDQSGDFKWEVFGRMLALRAKSPDGIREEEKKLVNNLGVEEIYLPPALLTGGSIVKGGTAIILDKEVDGRRSAIRLLHIEDDFAREHFVREVQLLRELNEKAAGKEVGQYIPILRQAGFLQADYDRGVLVYDWVDGEPLAQSCLSPFSVAHIGLALARVLAFFERQGSFTATSNPRILLPLLRLNGAI